MNRPAPRRPKQKPARLPAAPPIPTAREADAAPTATVTRAAESMSTARRDPSSANAAALSRWLTAKTLRSQFILTEILQPPLALREPRE